MAAQIIDFAKYRQARLYRGMSEALDDYEFAQELALLADVFEKKCRDDGDALASVTGG